MAERSWLARRHATREASHQEPRLTTLRGGCAVMFLLVIVVQLVGILLSIGTWADYREDKALQEHGVVVPGTVREYVDVSRGDHFVVDFRTKSGKPISAKVRVGDWEDKPKIGEAVSIRYTHPKSYAKDARVRVDPAAKLRLAMLATAFCLAVVPIAVVASKLARRRTRT